MTTTPNDDGRRIPTEDTSVKRAARSFDGLRLAAERALAPGSLAWIRVTSSQKHPHFNRVVSSDETVVRARLPEESVNIEVVGVAPGSAVLTVSQDDTATDSITVRVVDPAAVELVGTPIDQPLVAGGFVRVEVRPRHPSETYVGTNAGVAEVSGPLTLRALPSESFAMPPPFSHPNTWPTRIVVGGAAGTGTLTVRIGGAATSAPLTIADPLALASLRATPATLDVYNGTRSSLRVVALDGSGAPIRGAVCQWSVPSELYTPSGVDNNFEHADQPPGLVYEFGGGTVGTWTARCSVGGIFVDVPVIVHARQ